MAAEQGRLGRAASRGLLVVNADDWGAEWATTDAILSCFQAGAISSTTAMVFMEDSHRAAALARAHGLPVGLHPNLTMTYTDPQSSALAKEHQARLAELYATASRPHRSLHPAALHLVRDCVEDQLQEFHRLYGGPPAHIDGHNHAHLSTNVLLSRSLPRGIRLRRAQNWPRARTLGTHVARRVRDAALAAFHTTRWFTSIRTVHPAFGGRGLHELLEVSQSASVEIMVHPGWEDERDVLRAPDWAQALRGRPLGSYAELP
jgi:chitin disaccharide deacetylase